LADPLVITLPYKFSARSYQDKFVQAMNTRRNACLVWHRRAGKDKTALNFLIARAWAHRVGTYYYFFPTYAQGKKILWDGMDKEGMPFLHHFPEPLVESTNENEMQVKLRNGSIIQIIGTDKIDSIVGTNPIGCVFTEYAIQNPKAYDYVRPILAENDGWAVFCYTPRGKNHGYKLWRAAQDNPAWYTSLLTVEDTLRDSPAELAANPVPLPVTSPTAVDEERRSGMSEELIQQEFYCSFEGAMEGSYYGDLIARARLENRFLSESQYANLGLYNPSTVRVGWDLGIDDSTALIFERILPNGAPIIVGYYENQGQGLDFYRNYLLKRGFKYDLHFWPWDAQVREWSSGKTRYQYATSPEMGFTSHGPLGPIYVLPKIHNLADGINGTRTYLAKCYFLNTPEVGTLVDRLVSYRRVFDDKLGVWSTLPLHDWTSHGADAMRYLAQGWHELAKGPLPEHAESEFNPQVLLQEYKQSLFGHGMLAEAEHHFNPYSTPGGA